jgi:hypothetical protein
MHAQWCTQNMVAYCVVNVVNVNEDQSAHHCTWVSMLCNTFKTGVEPAAQTEHNCDHIPFIY